VQDVLRRWGVGANVPPGAPALPPVVSASLPCLGGDINCKLTFFRKADRDAGALSVAGTRNSPRRPWLSAAPAVACAAVIACS
jgi:hypothetical protein